LPFKESNFILDNYQNITIAIQVHVFYEDLLKEIINKLNLIPFKYDLFISTISKEKKEFIEKCLMASNANNYEIGIFKNIGRDV
jgi:rhamnosyltransferase